MAISAKQCRAARALLGWGQADLMKAAGVTQKTLSDFESGKTTPYESTLANIQNALESAGAVFVEPNGLGAGVRMREPGE